MSIDYVFMYLRYGFIRVPYLPQNNEAECLMLGTLSGHCSHGFASNQIDPNLIKYNRLEFDNRLFVKLWVTKND